MKQLLLMQGEPGCGKTSFIKEKGLKAYTISPDDIRLEYSSPQWVINENGQPSQVISQSINKKVWNKVYEILEFRMSNGDFTVVDATHADKKQLGKYKNLGEKYGYRIYLVNLSNKDVSMSKTMNTMRDNFKIVPNKVVERMHKKIKDMNIPNYITELPKDKVLSSLEWKIADFNKYNQIHVMGDIHGCYTAIQDTKIFTYDNIKDNPDNMFIFLGDYFDRGIENAKVFEYLESIKDFSNVVLLEGNHEKYLRLYARNEKDCNFMTKKELKSYYRSNAFIETTLKEFNDKGITKKRVNRLVRKLNQVAYFEYGGNVHVCTHGGITQDMVYDLNKVSTQQLIKGVGDYDTNIDKIWEDSLFNIIQFHGHRNTYGVVNTKDSKSFNLEQKVERGGTLSTVTICKLPTVKYLPKETKNTVYARESVAKNSKNKEYSGNTTVKQYFNDSLDSKDIRVINQVGNLYSINFTKKAFSKGHWDNITTRARGMFVRYKDKDSYIVGRGYDKFFNYSERDDTQLEYIENNYKFPLTAYVKENGFLGIVFYDDTRDKLVYASKKYTNDFNDDSGRYARLTEKVIKENLSKDNLMALKNYLKDFNVTAVFEIIVPDDDPHIIDYSGNKAILLDLIYNQLEFDKKPYNSVVQLAKVVNLEYKEKYKEINSPKELEQLIKETDNIDSVKHEGYVIEDSEFNMFKLKSRYYNTWKYLRTLTHSYFNGNNISFDKLKGLEYDYMVWLDKNKDSLEIDQYDIKILREKFYER